jgi:hypothetical protein
MSADTPSTTAAGSPPGGAHFWERLGAMAGILFAVLLVVGFVLRTNSPNYSDSQAWSGFYHDRGHRTQQIIGGYLLALAAFAFLWFQTEVVRRLRVRTAERGILPLLVFGSGLLFVALLLVAATAMISVPAGTTFGSAPVPSADFGIQFEQLGFGLLLFAGMLAAALFVALASVAGMRTGVLPRWLGWVGVVIGIVLLLGPVFFPAILLVLWAVTAGIVLLVRGS